MKELLWNMAHPADAPAENGMALFLPFGEWNFGGKIRQRLDKAHGEAIANELNARTARGEPGIPVYQGHPDVPEVAARYPDKGALGWITHIALGNQDGRDGLELTVEWDRHPGRGFRWFSPYWWCDMHADGLAEVFEIRSIGLVNNPNIPELRLANEDNLEKQQKGNDMDRMQVIQALGLPEAATDEEIVAAIEKLKAAAADAATKQEAAEAEKAQAVKEKDETAAALANERAARRGLLLDQAIAEGRISVAGRAAWEKRLAEDFAAGSVALANERAPKTESAVKETPAGRGAVNLVALANEKMKENPGMTYTAAFAQAMKEHPEVK